MSMSPTSDIHEEIANSVSHGLGLLAALAAVPLLLLEAHTANRPQSIGIIVFVASMALVYFSSTLYHALPVGRIKQLFLKLDYSAIFIFIAGSYTAFALSKLADARSWILMALVWSLAIVGILLKLFDRLTHPLHMLGYYLAMGWLTLIAIVPLTAHMSLTAVYWLIVGGLVYSLGTLFYWIGARMRFSHLGWHIFVMLGSGCHFVALLHN